MILYREEDFVQRVREITKGRLCNVVYDGVGAATFPGSLDCLAPFGMFVSFGSASGPVAAFDLGLLGQKGSLYATRPSLFTHIADRRVYEEMTEDLERAIKRGHLNLDAADELPAGGGGQGARGAGSPPNRRINRAQALTVTLRGGGWRKKSRTVTFSSRGARMARLAL